MDILQKVFITKVAGPESSVSTTESKPSSPKIEAPKQSVRRKTMKTFPKGVLKVKPVSDPAKPPPLRKTAKNQTVEILTDKGARRHRSTIRKSISKMSNDKVKALVEKNGLLKNKNTPPALMRDMLEGGAIAGFISID